MRVWIPPGTAMVLEGCRLVLLFMREQDAEAFFALVAWIDAQPAGTPITIERPGDSGPVQ